MMVVGNISDIHLAPHSTLCGDQSFQVLFLPLRPKCQRFNGLLLSIFTKDEHLICPSNLTLKFNYRFFKQLIDSQYTQM